MACIAVLSEVIFPHRMLQAAAPAPEELQGAIAWSGNGSGGTGTGQQSRARRATDAAMSIWKRASSRLFDLESKIVMQVGLWGFLAAGLLRICCCRCCCCCRCSCCRC